MSDDLQFGLRVLFWILALGTAILPMRLSLLSMILLSHIDITTDSFMSASSVGLENAAKTVIIPALLFLRFTPKRITAIRTSPIAVWWIALVLYAAVTCIWSPFVLSGLKMVAYLSCYLVLGAVFLEGWNSRQLTPPLLATSLWLSLAMATIQTYALGNPYGTSWDGLDVNRFTSFCSPQQFGAFLLAILSILLVTSQLRLVTVMLHTAGALAGIFLCGSRYVFLGALCLFPIVWVSHFVRSENPRTSGKWILAGALSILMIIISLGVIVPAFPNNRISKVIQMTLEGRSPLDNVGTFVWRQGIYRQAWNHLAEREPLTLLLGSGTSSGAEVVLGWDRRYRTDSIDANRVIHNEVLRIVFEWGLLGLLIFFLWATKILSALRIAINSRVIPAYSFLALLPTVILGCLSENILSGSSAPAGVGFSLVLVYGMSYARFAARPTIGRPREYQAINIGNL